MCGICGVIHFDGEPVTRRLLQAMNDRLWHRGPDGSGYFIDGSFGFAMRRLRIIDIAGSDQPLYSEDHSIALIFNGEIYNYQTLRQQLQQRGHRFRTAGDGETIVHLYEDEGAAGCQQLRGMYAIALWDGRAKRLLLARDRLGQKPLYYYRDARRLVFASEIKAILAHPSVPRRSIFAADPSALSTYLSFGYPPAPGSAFQDILMLPPATTLEIDADGQAQQRCYWDLQQRAMPQPPAPQAQPAAYIAPLREKLDEAVKLRMMSDVPLGAFLSGGLDSSLIAALMRRHSSAAIQTFSIGFEGDDSFDETAYARQVAQFLQTEHRAFRVKPDALKLLADLVWHHDQPFADSSAIPTFLVSQLTRTQVTVALSGDGGDELFAGYERFRAAQLFQQLAPIPASLWRALSRLLAGLPEGTAYYSRSKRARRFAQAASKDPTAAYFELVRLFSADALQEICQSQADVCAGLAAYIDPRAHPLAALLAANMRSYLPDDLLIKADRCSMQASLETRAPFLDHPLVEYAATIPLNLKLRGAETKFILKEAARGLLPAEIIARRKHGFGLPLGAWLRRDISPMRAILLSRRARERGFFDMRVVERLIDEHAAGQRDHNRQLWTLLTFEEWQRQFIDPAQLPPAANPPPGRARGHPLDAAAQSAADSER